MKINLRMEKLGKVYVQIIHTHTKMTKMKKILIIK